MGYVRVFALAMMVSCSVSTGTGDHTEPVSSGRQDAESKSACTARGIASLAGGFSGLFGAGDADAVSAVLALDEEFHWISDVNVRPIVSISDRSDAVQYVAAKAMSRYDLKQIRLTPRIDEVSADIVFLLKDSRARLLLGKGLVKCTPPSIMSWTIGSSGPAAGPKPCEGDTEARRIGTLVVCLAR